VTGNAPFRKVDHSQDAGCEVSTPLGVACFYGLGSTFGADAYFDLWDGDTPVLVRDFDQPATVAFGADGSVAMEIPLLPSGVAVVAGTLTPADTIDYTDRFRDGNSWYRSSSTGTAFAFTGSLTMPGVADPVPFGPEGCGGSEVDSTTFITVPHARVFSFSSTGGFCELSNAEGDTAVTFIDSFVETLDDGASVTIVSLFGSATDSAGGEIGFDGSGEGGRRGHRGVRDVQYDPATGDSWARPGAPPSPRHRGDVQLHAPRQQRFSATAAPSSTSAVSC
jgi:hypothetical protein